MKRTSRLRLLAAPTLALAVLLFAVPGALSQAILPPALSQELQMAAAIARSMANEPRIGDSGFRSGESVMAHAVVVAISQHPAYAAPIVQEAIGLTPAYGPTIVAAASEAFPAFSAAFGGGAQTTMVAQPAPVTPAPAPVYVTPSYLQPAPAPVYTVPAPMAVAEAPEPATPIYATDLATSLHEAGITELWLGGMAHDAGVFGRSKEESVGAIDFGIRFQTLHGEFWDLIANPKPHTGFHISTAGDTSQWFGGFSWQFDLGYRLFFGADFGLAFHDGKLRASGGTDEKELGVRFLFREGAELGYRLDGRHAISLVLDHISNGRLASANEDLDSFGLRYTYRHGPD